MEQNNNNNKKQKEIERKNVICNHLVDFDNENNIENTNNIDNKNNNDKSSEYQCLKMYKNKNQNHYYKILME